MNERRKHVIDAYVCYYYGSEDQQYCGNDIAKGLAVELMEGTGMTVYRDYDKNKGNIKKEIESAFRNSLMKVIVLTTAYIEKCNEVNPPSLQRNQFLAAIEYSKEYIIPILYEPELSDIKKWPEGIVKDYLEDRTFFSFTNSKTKERNLREVKDDMVRKKSLFQNMIANRFIEIKYETDLLAQENAVTFDCFLSHTWTNSVSLGLVKPVSKVEKPVNNFEEPRENNFEQNQQRRQQTNTHADVIGIKNNLGKRSIRCWLDDGQLMENYHEEIVSGLKMSKVFIVFITDTYLDKLGSIDEDVARELDFAIKVKGVASIIPVVLSNTERCLNPRNWPEQLKELRAIIYVDFSNNESCEKNFDMLCKRINSRLH